MMNKWTVALAATGVVSLASAVLAEEAKSFPVNTALSATTLSGFVDTSAIWNFGSGGAQAARFANTDGSQGKRQDGFNLNVVDIALEKPLDEGTWSAGYKFELWAGPDAGALPGSLSPGLAVKQAYVDVRAPIGNGLDIKVGQYDTIIGYEVANSLANPNFSRSFGFNLEPLSHTGVLVSYQFTDAVGLAAGVADSAFGKINATSTVESVKTYLAGLSLKAPDSFGWLAGSTLYAGVIDGGKGVTAAGPDTVNLYVGGSISTPIKALSLGVSYDYLANGAGATSGLTSKTSYADAYAVYASYQLTEKLKLNLRGEYATDDYGNFISTAKSEKVVSGTLTADYSLWANVISRAEFRWDHAASGSVAAGDPLFNKQKNDYSLLVNLIYKF
jgi:Putative beta-barrel porin-2, OmpL-like. bbp2